MLRHVELSVGRPPDPSWKRPPGRPRTKWTDQLRRDNNNVPIATLHVEASHWSRSLESDATVRADYALTTTTTAINLVGKAVVVVERDPLVAEHRERHVLFADPEHISPASNHVTHLHPLTHTPTYLPTTRCCTR